ncbi:AraC family transcriptional regulator [Neobacillus drentensis]|uniref:AraC family transcriptional regulator n=1 Tax=Neobacillus drentensis TaxID=220684 RepID=UPI002FFDBCB5
MNNHVTLQKLYEAMKIPLQLFDNHVPIQNYGSGEFYPNPAISMINSSVDNIHSVCYTVLPENLFCGLIRIDNSSQYVIVGPAMAFECTRNQAEKILESLQQPVNRINEFLHWFRTIPNCDLQRFRSILVCLDYFLNGAEHEPVHIAYQVNPSPTLSIDTNPTFIDHVSDLLEKQMLSYIEYGNTNALETVLNDMETTNGGGVPKLAPDVVRSFKNIFIVSTTLSSRAAVKGGLDFDTANALTTRYLTQIEKIKNYSEIFILLKQMFLDFAKRTARSRSYLSDSLLVNKISKEVQAHLYEKITPASIAERLRMNGSYLSTHFKKETGKTLTEFINEVKIKEGIRLLETTQMPLIQISAQLGFSSQNYFHTVFKKITGMTPVEYRNKT